MYLLTVAAIKQRDEKVVVSGLATKNETFHLDDKGRPEKAQVSAVPLKVVGNVPAAIGVEEALVEERQLLVRLIGIVQQVVLVSAERPELVLHKVLLQLIEL